jgi:hypothetical protein
MLDSLVAALINRLAAWLVGASFFRTVLDAVSYFDGRIDLDGDGKKEAVIQELTSLGILFGRKQINLAIELAVQLLERKK